MSGFRGMGMHRVRWIVGGEPEMQCELCFEFMPITDEFWQPAWGLRRCRACVAEATRERTRRYRMRRRLAGVPAVRQAYDTDRYRRTQSVLARALAEERVAS